MAIQIAIMAKPCCNVCPATRSANNLPKNIPATVAPQKGIAIDQFNAPINIAEVTPVREISAIMASDVANIDGTLKSVTFLSVGTIINPPPTPRRPDKNPAAVPDRDSALKQGMFQIKRPSMSSNRQGGSSVLRTISVESCRL